eukprot:jgi/Botrbrau1/12020/Bobra.247_2s0024.1
MWGRTPIPSRQSVAAVSIAVLLLVNLAPVLTQEEPAKECLISEFGATGDGETLDTAALQHAIDACSNLPSGGIVKFEDGKSYLLGSVKVNSGVRLELPPGTTLIASSQREDYPDDPQSWYLLRFEGCEKCGLLGPGQIDGQASDWIEAESEDRKTMRNWDAETCPSTQGLPPWPHRIVDSSQITIASVTINDPVWWAVHILRSEAVALVSVAVMGQSSIPYSGGVIIDGSSRVYVGRCAIETGDDAIALQTTGKGEVNSVLVDSCELKSRSSAFKIGSETRSDISAVLVQHCTIAESNRGLAIQARDEGKVFGITFTNISVATQHYGEEWWGAAEPIHVSAVPRSSQSNKVGLVYDIKFNDIRAESEGGVVLRGPRGRAGEH